MEAVHQSSLPENRSTCIQKRPSQYKKQRNVSKMKLLLSPQSPIHLVKHLLNGLKLHVFIPIANPGLVGVTGPTLELLRSVLHTIV